MTPRPGIHISMDLIKMVKFVSLASHICHIYAYDDYIGFSKHLTKWLLAPRFRNRKYIFFPFTKPPLLSRAFFPPALLTAGSADCSPQGDFRDRLCSHRDEMTGARRRPQDPEDSQERGSGKKYM